MKPSGSINVKASYSLGVDLARMGEDSTVMIVVEQPAFDTMLYVVHIEEINHSKLTNAIGRIRYLDMKFNFNKILIDSTGLGAAVVDVLKEELKFKIEDISFSMQSKESLYGNLKWWMEKGRLKLPSNLNDTIIRKLYYQLLEMRYKFAKNDKNIMIHHPPRGHDDYPDALALACYHFRRNDDYRPTLY